MRGGTSVNSTHISKQNSVFIVGAFLGFFYLFLFSFPLASAITWNADFTTVNVNSSNYWNTGDHGSLGSISDISHSWLNNLGWSVSGHTMDANLDMNSYNIQEIDKAYFDSGAFISSDDSGHLDLHADYIDLHGNLSTIWNVRLNTDGNGSVGSSYGNLVFGSGGDTYLYYNGSDFIIDPDAVGSGDVVVSGDIRADNFLGNGSGLTGIISDNSSWNEAYANALYYGIENPSGYYNFSDFDITNYVPYTGATSNLDLGDNNLSVGGSDFFVDASGRVGIGTTSPTNAKLQVEGNGTYDGMFRLSNTGTNGASFFMGSTADGWGAGVNKFIMGHGSPSSTNTDVTIDSSGNVGIGIASPSAKLEVHGGTYVGTSWVNGDDKFAVTGADSRMSLVSTDAGTYGSALSFKQVDGTVFENSWDIIRQTNGDGVGSGALSIAYGTSANADANARMFTIATGGNVGIGTTTPDTKLQIDGDFTSETNATDSIGTSLIQWLNGFFVNLFVSNNLEVGGDLNVTGSITRGAIPFMYGLATEEIALTTTGQWYNITFNESISVIKGNLTFENNRTLTIKEDGNYLIAFGVQIVDSSASPSAHVATRIIKNGAQLGGSYVETETDKQNFQKWLDKSSYAYFEEGDTLEMQVISSDATVSLLGLNTYNEGYGSIAYGWIERID